MNYLRKKSVKKLLCFVLVIALCVVGIVVPEGEIVEAKKISSVFDEIQEANLSKKELAKISKTALKDGEKAAEKINQYADIADYEAAVNYALSAYYENEEFEEIKDFENNIDGRSNDIVKGYKAAAKERKKGDANGYEAGKVLVAFDGNATKEEIKAVVEAEYGKCEEIVKCFNNQYMVKVSISLGQTVEMAEEAYSKYSIIENTAPNDYVELAESAADYVNEPNAKNQYYLDNIKAKEAWDYVSQTQYDKVTVGVIDTGVQIDHPDMQNVISPYSADVTEGDTPVLLSECDVTYTSSHGTMVAGVLAAEANNNAYIAGVASCYNNDVVEVLAVQTSTYYADSNTYRFESDDVVKAINYCVEQGAKVINFSAGALGEDSYLASIIKDVTNAGVIFVCAAGNDGTSNPFTPADIDETISVVATDTNNALWSDTNYGMKKDICAPGVDIMTISSQYGQSMTRGTSFATPMVSAVAAMMCAVNSNLDYRDVRRILADTATDINVGNKCRNGLLNAGAAVKMADTLYDKGLSWLSLRKPVTVSSSFSADFPASNMVDGADNTKWISELADGQSVTIDLENVYLIENIDVWYDRYIVSGLQIEVSTDGVNWREVTNDDVATLYTTTIVTGAIKARYVRFNYTGNTSYVIIKELNIMGYEVLTKEPPKVTNTIDGGIEVNGYQISATVGGFRTVYSVDSEIDGKKVVSSGIIYSLADYVGESELYVGSTNYYVHSYESTSAGISDTLFADSDIATSYAMTMKFATKEAAEYNANWRIRAYAKLSDGTYVYTKAYTYKIYDVADYLYSGRKMNTKAHHDYLYSNILSIVNKEYKVVDYDWSDVVVGA